METLLATIKLRAASININYRYVRDELAYHLRDADLSALRLRPGSGSGRGGGSPPELPRVAIGADIGQAVSFGEALCRPVSGRVGST